jgi:hypothetical protein
MVQPTYATLMAATDEHGPAAQVPGAETGLRS